MQILHQMGPEATDIFGQEYVFGSQKLFAMVLW
jgi:hypothetical protein